MIVATNVLSLHCAIFSHFSLFRISISLVSLFWSDFSIGIPVILFTYGANIWKSFHEGLKAIYCFFMHVSHMKSCFIAKQTENHEKITSKSTQCCAATPFCSHSNQNCHQYIGRIYSEKKHHVLNRQQNERPPTRKTKTIYKYAHSLQQSHQKYRAAKPYQNQIQIANEQFS